MMTGMNLLYITNHDQFTTSADVNTALHLLTPQRIHLPLETLHILYWN